MVGVMSSYYVLVVLKWGQLPAFFLVTLFVVLIAMFEERAVVRMFLKKQGNATFGWFIATLGFSLVLETIVNVSFGHHPITKIPSPFKLGGYHLGKVIFGYRQMFIVVTFFALIILLELFYQRTWIGQAMRGTAEDREAASLLGINPITVSRVAFALGGLVAGYAGFAIAPITFSDPTIGLAFTLKGFLALAIGGVGSIRGAIPRGLVLGVGGEASGPFLGAQYDGLAGPTPVLVGRTPRPGGAFK